MKVSIVDFKNIDCAIQVISMVVGLGMAITSGDFLSETTFMAYFIVGGWQLLSVIAHFFYKPPYDTRQRRIYLWTLGAVIMLLVLSIPVQGIIIALVGLLFFSPVMAIYYLATCIKETRYLSAIKSQKAGIEEKA